MEFFNFSHRTVEPVASAATFSTKTDQKKGNKGTGRKSSGSASLVKGERGRRASLALILPGVNRGWFELLITRYLRNGLREGEEKKETAAKE